MREIRPRYFDAAPDTGRLVCGLCFRRCTIPPGKAGACGVRFNAGGRPALPRYGHITALALDPVEKKPLYHWRPGSAILSLGFAGCNFFCPFCQNWRISRDADAAGRPVSPEELIARAQEAGVSQIAYTYSEPLIHAEYLFDCMTAAGEAGMANVLVTNGSANPRAAEEILSLTSAANIDLKCFSEKTYREILGGDFDTVKNFIRCACGLGVHVEITTLVVPGLNDAEPELDRLADFIAGLAESAVHPGMAGMDDALRNDASYPPPWHLTAYHPDYRWTVPPPTGKNLHAAACRARRKLPFVYTGNTGGENTTACLCCGAVLAARQGFRVNAGGLVKRGGRWHCAACGAPAPFRG
ncbi:MAG: AmmeMemoRadiSam system radical SAM enzyme [Spirochaetaceae bacterium]|nr:AmmeMemoRadiSam system radical SAM enzyme [Spirochaetaceae bacterium]